MPRKARLDKGGFLHHVIARGIERSPIFRDDVDRERFIERLGLLAELTKTDIYAFALVPNHFHLLLRSGPEGLSRFMRRLLTGYAVSFNNRHERAGHLFQNRYKSIVVEEDPYFVELLRYIHLNPLNAHVTPTLETLDSYRFSGHYYLIHKNPFPWYDAAYVLRWFGNSKKNYRAFMREGVEKKYLPDLSGGGLIRTLGGISQAALSRRTPVLTDERVLGSGEFLKELVRKEPHPFSDRYKIMEEIIVSLCQKEGISREALAGGSRAGKLSRLRSELVFLLSREVGIPQVTIARELGITTSAVSKIMRRREDKSG
ncbi:MAG TPA: transposase [Syntrophorhabdaceae bacterium]|jgi:REP element-mobilizing transposase RayT